MRNNFELLCSTSGRVILGLYFIGPGALLKISNMQGTSEYMAEHGMVFIGPSHEHITLMGDKIAAKEAVMKAGIPVVPGSDGGVDTFEDAKRIADEIGYPVIIKATAGGGGRGMKMAPDAASLETAFRTARSEAEAAFGNGAVYIEKFLTKPRHIEIQVLADSFGNVVHLGERDCSLQRRHQKVLEEAPSPALNAEQRESIGRIAAEAVKKIGYRSAGTIEFLFEDGEFYFRSEEHTSELQSHHDLVCRLLLE